MARPATGWIKWRTNKKTGLVHWHVRLSLPDGSRPFVPLDPSIPYEDRERAKACAGEVAAEAKNSGVVPDTTRETARQWFKRFHAEKERRGLSTVDAMKGRAENWIFPVVGDLDMRAIARVQCEAIVRKLDRAIESYEKHGRGEGRLSPSTAANIWGDFQHAMDEAVNAKDPALRALTENPSKDIRGPETGEDREGPILYSDEVVALLRGKAVDEGDDDVPLYRRRVYAMATYTMARRSELAALTVGDVDFAHETISISKQVDRRKTGLAKGATKKTKTKRSRTPDIEPHLLPLVCLLVAEAGPKKLGARLLRVPPSEDCAELLRKDLWTVGARRQELHTEDSSRTRVWFHHLRDTGLTHMAVRGDTPTVIQWRAGHTDYKMTQSYVERGRTEARRIGTPLPPLPTEVLVPSPKGSASDSATILNLARKLAVTKGFSATPTGIEPVLPT